MPDFGSILGQFQDFIAPLIGVIALVFVGGSALTFSTVVKDFFYAAVNGVATVFIAKKLKVKNAWCAFIPYIFAPVFAGKLAEASDKITTPGVKVKKWGAKILDLYLTIFISAVIALIVAIALFILGLTQVLDMAIAGIIATVAFAIVGIIAVINIIILTVYDYVVRYRLYKCFAGKHSVWMILVDLFGGLFIGLLPRIVFSYLIGVTPIFKGHLRNNND